MNLVLGQPADAWILYIPSWNMQPKSFSIQIKTVGYPCIIA